MVRYARLVLLETTLQGLSTRIVVHRTTIFFGVDNLPLEVNRNTQADIIRYIDQTVHSHIPAEDSDPDLRS